MASIGLLAIAMMAALYSSNAARNGNAWSAGVSAVAALMIAIAVAIKFVPRLASHVDWHWLPFLSHYHITREGWIYFGAVAIVVFAAINTANNLLYIILSALLAVLILSGFLSALNFRSLRTAIRIPSRCYAGEPFPITVQVRNEKTVFPTFAISFEPPRDSPFRFSSFYVPMIRGLEDVSQTEHAMLPKRGRFRLHQVKASSRYPFGFFLKNRNYPVEDECICYPEIVPQEEMDIAGMDLQGSNERFERGLGHDLYMIRDYVPSDSARHVHWKASAKTSILKTREYAAEEARTITLAFDRFGRAHDADAFDQLVSLAASLAFHLTTNGLEVTFMSDEWHGSTIESTLEYLALVEMSIAAELPRVDEEAVMLSLRT
ncbi:MAG TPA: DUF58 domain-containing protein [Terriglobia bacterium]|nr:DUF58 domain-containing protein [Terriglobia bacterium]